MRAVLVPLNAEQHNVFNVANVAEGWDIAATISLSLHSGVHHMWV